LDKREIVWKYPLATVCPCSDISFEILQHLNENGRCGRGAEQIALRERSKENGESVAPTTTTTTTTPTTTTAETSEDHSIKLSHADKSPMHIESIELYPSVWQERILPHCWSEYLDWNYLPITYMLLSLLFSFNCYSVSSIETGWHIFLLLQCLENYSF
jgi:hypothetical protein